MTHAAKMTDGTLLQLPTPMLSFTQVNMYLKCPMQYHFRYVLGRKDPPGIAMVEGSCAHNALEMSNLHQIDQGEPLPAKELHDKFGDEFATRRKQVEDWTDKTCPGGKATPDLIQARAATYLKTFVEDIAPDYVPTAAERKHVISVKGIPLQAYTDLETKGGVFDYKVSKAQSPYFRKGSAEGSLQLSVYAHATGKKRVGYIGLLKDKPKQYKFCEAKRGPGDWAYAEEIIVGVAKAISAGAFPMCGPEQFLCDPRWCGYWGSCRGKLLGSADKTSVVVPKITIKKAPPKRGQTRK